jgi:predicted transcriptional regulator
MATLPMYLEVKAPAVGPLLIEFRNNPDIVKVAIPPGETLPSPTKMVVKANKQDIKQEPAGRSSRGTGRELLLQALAAGMNTRADLIKHLCESGMSPKSAQGILERAKRDKLVTSDGRGVYALTAKGKKIISELAHSAGKHKHEEV